MEITYQPRGVCASNIVINIENNIVTDVKFVGGCSGNTQGIGALTKGMTVEEVIYRLEGIRCGQRNTSCPDQLSKALKENK